MTRRAVLVGLAVAALTAAVGVFLVVRWEDRQPCDCDWLEDLEGTP